MAYVLGFFAADGAMIQNNRGAHFIEFHNTDKSILLKIRSVLGSNHTLGVREARNKKWQTRYRLQLGSKTMFDDLSRFGFAQNKSKTMKLPNIPLAYTSHYVRGYFDGDGNVYFKRHFVKARLKRRWVFSSRFTSGSLEYLEALHKILALYNLNGGFIQKKNRGHELVFSHKDSLALFRLMYNNASGSLFLKRKFDLFRKAIATLYPEEMRE